VAAAAACIVGSRRRRRQQVRARRWRILDARVTSFRELTPRAVRITRSSVSDGAELIS